VAVLCFTADVNFFYLNTRSPTSVGRHRETLPRDWMLV